MLGSAQRRVPTISGAAALAPYLTAGKEIGKLHVLATTRFSFAAGSAPVSSDYFYLNLHLDRQCFGWLYPLIEFNAIYHSKTASLDLPTRFGFINTTFNTSRSLILLRAALCEEPSRFEAVRKNKPTDCLSRPNPAITTFSIFRNYVRTIVVVVLLEHRKHLRPASRASV